MNREKQIQQKLNLLAELQQQEDEISHPYHEQIAKIEASIEEAISELSSQKELLTTEIKQECLEFGKSVSGTILQVLFVKGRVSWDSKGLEGFSLTHPEILQLRKEGKPSTRIQKRKTK